IIYQDKTSGTENEVPMAAAGYDSSGNPIPNQYLYLNYPTTATPNTVSGGTMERTDGVMPDDFPYPFDPNLPSTLPGYTPAQLASSAVNRLVDQEKIDYWLQTRTDPQQLAVSGNP